MQVYSFSICNRKGYVKQDCIVTQEPPKEVRIEDNKRQDVCSWKLKSMPCDTIPMVNSCGAAIPMTSAWTTLLAHLNLPLVVDSTGRF